jgi:hypothetical protein
MVMGEAPKLAPGEKLPPIGVRIRRTGHYPMCAQKPSPQKKFRDPANLVNEFVHFVGTILLIPHGAIFRFPTWIDP